MNVCFLAPGFDGSAIQQAGASEQGQSSEKNPIPDAVESLEDFVRSASIVGDNRLKGSKKRKEKEGGPGMCGKLDMSVEICQLIRV